MKRSVVILSCFVAVAASGCATNLKNVRDFADETKKIAVGFDPILAATVEQCRQKAVLRVVYATRTPIATFDPEAFRTAVATECKVVADKNDAMHGIGGTLAEYADRLSALAADGVASSVDDDYVALAKKIDEAELVPKAQVGAVTDLFKYLTRAIVAERQKQAIEEALSHEAAVGTLGDAMVVYAERAYAGFANERLQTIGAIVEGFQRGDIVVPPVVARLEILDLYQQQLDVAKQQKSIAALKVSVDQMKVAMHDVRTHLDRLSAAERRAEVVKLAKDVRTLFQELDKAF